MLISYCKTVELIGEYDVAVLGGGPAGVCAAIEAARCGRKVLLAEATGMLGGMATAGLVGPFMTCYDRDGDEQIIKGLFDEIVGRMVELSGALSPDKTDSPSRWTSFLKKYHRRVTPFDSFVLQLVLDRMAREAGVHTLLYTKYVDSICMDGGIESIILAVPEGLVAARAEIYIDCTGNADVAAASGVETWIGGEDGAPPQPGTLFFEVDNVEDVRYTSRPQRPVKAYQKPLAGSYKINHDRVYGVDATDARSLTEAHMKAREQILQSYRTLRSTPGFENCSITQVAPVLGVRESRHIRGLYMLTVRDLGEGRIFEDAVACCGYGMDVHSRDGQIKGGFHGEVAKVYTIPYRCMVPVGCSNLLVAGKTICAESQAAGSFRIMPGCMALGQAAGAAAALACETGVQPGQVDTGKLRALLKGHGAYII
ncbi:MAG TPA: FAD-dependent oxidoreductase [Clostridiales bacterium]|nr:FAD-dependent oxidoreductase [Clostridiales bacterium]